MTQLSVEDLVRIDLQYSIAICKLCDNAIRPSGIEGHYRTHQVKGQALQDVKIYLACVELRDPVTSKLPADGSVPVEHLPVLRGFKCAQCRHLTIASNSARQHWRLAGHQLGEGEEGPRWTEVLLQAWIWAQARLSKYWIVNEDGDTGDESEEGSDSALAKVIADFEADMNAEDAERLRRGDEKEDIDRDSAWVKRAGWVKHFDSRDLLDIHEAAQWVHARGPKKQLAAKEEEEAARERIKLLRLGASFDREVERCCYRLDSVPTETLQWLAGVSSTAPAGSPFGRKGKEASMAKYRSIGQRYLGFCLRAYQLGRAAALDRWAVGFTDEQWSLLGDIVFELDGGISSSDDSGYHSNEEDDR